MIRVFLISMLALTALVVVSRYLPERPVAEIPEGAEAAPATGDDLSPFARFEGDWEGTFNAYEPDGSLIRSLHVRQRHVPVSATEQAIVIKDRFPDGATRSSTAFSEVVDGGLECRLTGPDGVEKILEGRRRGESLWWHRSDAQAHLVESYRERIVRLDDGDLYAIDGVGVYGAEGEVVVFEGRYRRVGQAPE